MELRMTLVLFAVALLSAGRTPGQAITAEFSGTAILAGPPTAIGTITCPGGKPTGLYPLGPPCTPGSRVYARGVRLPYVVLATDARIAGFVEVTLNGNFDGWRPDLAPPAPGSGQIWGTLRLDVVADGIKTGEVWEGTWTGTRTVTGDRVVTVNHNVLHGSGGRIEGLMAEFDDTEDSVTGISSLEGRILAPPGKSGK